MSEVETANQSHMRHGSKKKAEVVVVQDRRTLKLKKLETKNTKLNKNIAKMSKSLEEISQPKPKLKNEADAETIKMYKEYAIKRINRINKRLDKIKTTKDKMVGVVDEDMTDEDVNLMEEINDNTNHVTPKIDTVYRYYPAGNGSCWF